MASKKPKKIGFLILYFITTHCLHAMELSEKLTELTQKLTTLKTRLAKLQTKLVKLNQHLTRKPLLTHRTKDILVYPACFGVAFQASFLSQKKFSSEWMSKTCSFDAIPQLGQYTDPYTFRTQMCVIELRNNMLEKAPEHVIQAISTKLGVHQTSKAILDKINNSGIIFYLYTIIHGNDLNGMTYLRTNIVFHPLLEHNLIIHGKLPPEDAFIENVSMGIFDYDGVTPADLGNNALKEISVHYHDGCYSPDNAAFNITGDRATGSFWSVAIPQNPKVIAVTYHLVINQKDVATRLEEKIGDNFETNNIGDVFKHLETEKATLAQESDRKTIETFIKTLTNIIS